MRLAGLAVGLLVLLAGCSLADDQATIASETASGSTEASAPPDLVVEEVGWSEIPGPDSTAISWAVVLNNPSTLVAFDARLRVEFMDSTGRVFSEETEEIPVVPEGRYGWAREQSGVTLNGGGSLVFPADPIHGLVEWPVSAQASVEVAGWREPIDGDEAPRWSNVEIDYEAFPLTVGALIGSESAVDLPAPAVVVVVRDADGAIQGGGRWYAPCLPAGDTVRAAVANREFRAPDLIAAVEFFALPASPDTTGPGAYDPEPCP